MPISLFGLGTSNKKTEGTSITYGQSLSRTQSTSTNTTINSSNKLGVPEVMGREDFVQSAQSDKIDEAINSIDQSTQANSGEPREIPTGNELGIDLLVEPSEHKSKEEMRAALERAKQGKLKITLRSKHSLRLEANTLKTPYLLGRFVYSSYLPDEGNIGYENLTQKELSAFGKIPKHIELNWEPVSVTNDVSLSRGQSAEQKREKQKHFSFATNRLSFTTKRIDGIEAKIPDANDIVTSLKSTSNGKMFSNTVKVVTTLKEPLNYAKGVVKNFAGKILGNK